MKTFLQPYNIPEISLEYLKKYWNTWNSWNSWNVLRIFWKHCFMITGICKKKHLFSSSIHYYTTIIHAKFTTFFYVKATVFYLSEYLVESVVSAASNVNYWEGNWCVFIYFITKNYFLVTIVTFWAFNSFQFFNL